MASIVTAEAFGIFVSIVGLVVCWRHSIASVPLLRRGALVALCLSTCISILPEAFYLLEPSSGSGLIAARVYAIGTLLLFTLVGCPSAIALYFARAKRSYFWLFCVSTLASTFGTCLIGMSCMGLAQ